MHIKKHIENARAIVFWQDGLKSLLWFGILISILFLIGIELETIFYFLPKIKISILTLMGSCLILYSLFWLIQYFRSESDLIQKYKIETLSTQLGQSVFPKKQDTILNALQLESGSGKNESKALTKSYIKKISDKLNELDFVSHLKDEKVNKTA